MQNVRRVVSEMCEPTHISDTTKGSSSIVTGPTQMYNAAGQPTEVDLTGTDKDTYTYDSNTGNMTQYVFQVGSANETGVLNWNPNHTLQQLAITDGFNSGGSQTCASSYDDLVRLTVFDCGSGNWGQDFGYDQYDNLTQTVISGRSGSTWNPGYNSSNNQVTGATYDASGDMTKDGGMNVYGYDEFNKVAWTAGSGTPTCGTNGKCITYDALGRMVEKSSGSTWTEIWYTQVPGSQVNMSGTVANYAYWPSPGRGTFLAMSNNLFMHQDWLGNDRVVSYISSHTVQADRAYAPYGEQYSTFGGTNPIYGMFAGLTGDFDPGVLFDTPNRELAQYQGRWLSPDPAGSGWNQYAYVSNNPLGLTDPTGLDSIGVASCSDPHIRALCQAGNSSLYSNFPSISAGWSSGWDSLTLYQIPVVQLIGYSASILWDPTTGQIASFSVTPQYAVVGSGVSLLANRIYLDPCVVGLCVTRAPPPPPPPPMVIRATLPMWERMFMQLGCILGQQPDNLGPAPSDSVPQDSTDSTLQTEGQQELYGPNKAGRQVLYNAGSGVPSAAAGATAHGATAADCLTRVPD
jgi:RHS repeat-associated protein